MINAQAWLDEKYPLETRKNIIKMEIDENNLKGSLKLENFINLEEFSCSDNKITSLEIINSPNLERLYCYGNQITELNVTNLHKLIALCCNGNKLTKLELHQNKELYDLIIGDNNFPEQDLSFLSHLVNLKRLELGNIMKWEGENIYNRFTGSLENLQNMTKLRTLEIGNTDIDSGLEYLPISLREFGCMSEERKESKVNLIAEELKKLGEVGKKDNFIHLLKEWRKNNSELVMKILWEKVNKIEEELTIEREHTKNIDNWYRNLIEEEKKVKKVAEKQRDNLKQQVQQLKKQLEDLLIKENKIEVFPKKN